jgi:hypothetical protein
MCVPPTLKTKDSTPLRDSHGDGTNLGAAQRRAVWVSFSGLDCTKGVAGGATGLPAAASLRRTVSEVFAEARSLFAKVKQQRALSGWFFEVGAGHLFWKSKSKRGPVRDAHPAPSSALHAVVVIPMAAMHLWPLLGTTELRIARFGCGWSDAETNAWKIRSHNGPLRRSVSSVFLF